MWFNYSNLNSWSIEPFNFNPLFVQWISVHSSAHAMKLFNRARKPPESSESGKLVAFLISAFGELLTQFVGQIELNFEKLNHKDWVVGIIQTNLEHHGWTSNAKLEPIIWIWHRQLQIIIENSIKSQKISNSGSNHKKISNWHASIVLDWNDYCIKFYV